MGISLNILIIFEESSHKAHFFQTNIMMRFLTVNISFKPNGVLHGEFSRVAFHIDNLILKFHFARNEMKYLMYMRWDLSLCIRMNKNMTSEVSSLRCYWSFQVEITSQSGLSSTTAQLRMDRRKWFGYPFLFFFFHSIFWSF